MSPSVIPALFLYNPNMALWWSAEGPREDIRRKGTLGCCCLTARTGDDVILTGLPLLSDFIGFIFSWDFTLLSGEVGIEASSFLLISSICLLRISMLSGGGGDDALAELSLSNCFGLGW